MTQSQKERNEQLRALRAQGMTYAQIADRIGISRQRVASICGRFGQGHYSGVFMRQWAYLNIVAWMTENRLTFSEFLRRIGYDHPAPNIIQRWRDIMIAKHDPRKRDIDRMIAVTGLNYETLFAKERT